VTPALLLLGRLGRFSRPSRGFQFRNPLHELGEQRVGTSAGFALLLHLALEVADTVAQLASEVLRAVWSTLVDSLVVGRLVTIRSLVGI
jgi:hypothetical protein